MNKKRLILITSLVTILPALSGFVGSVFLLGIHLLGIWGTEKDPGNKEQNVKAMRMIYWCCPFLSIYMFALSYAVQKGGYIDIEKITYMLMGLSFVIIGNYLPKCKQNFTIGIKVPWVYTSEENWNKTHRLGGKIWVACGMLMLLTVFVKGETAVILMVADILIMILVPVVYSYLYYRKEKSEGNAAFAETLSPKAKKFSIVLVSAITVGVGVLMFAGDIEFSVGEQKLEIEAFFWEDLEIDYDEIDSIEYKNEDEAGSRVGGYGSARLLMGNFRNEEFDYYTRYSYTKCDSGIVLMIDGKAVVISAENEEMTKKLYNDLKEKM